MVSERASVSKTTVSRFLNGKFEYMSAETKDRIQSVIDELDYRPNTMAQSLKNNKSGLLGLVIDEIDNPITSKFVKGVFEYFKKTGFQIITIETDGTSIKNWELIKNLIDYRVEGFIVNSNRIDEQLINELVNQEVDIVLADMFGPNNFKNTVGSNYNFVVDEFLRMSEHLKVDRIFYFFDSSSSKVDYKKHKLLVEKFKIKNAEIEFIEMHKIKQLRKPHIALQKILEEQIRVGFFFEDLATGIPFLNEIFQVINIPLNNYMIFGYDPHGIYTKFSKNIGVFSHPSREIGTEAARLLHKIIEDEKKKLKPKRIKVQPKLTFPSIIDESENNFDRLVRVINEENEILDMNYTKR